MARKIALLMLVSLLAGSSAAAQNWARKMFRITHHDFGSVARGATVEYRFVLTNVYGEDIHIAGVRSSCGCTRPRVEQSLLKPGATGAIVAALNTRSFLGQHGATLTVTFDRPYYAEAQLQVRGYIRSDVVFHPGKVQLGCVNQHRPAHARVDVDYAGRSDWKILRVTSPNPHLTAQVVEAERHSGRVKYCLVVHLDKQAPVGYLRDYLTLTTDDRRATRIPLLVEGRVTAAVTVSPSSLFMGVVEPGREVTKKLVVRSEKPFRIVSIHCADTHFRFDISASDAARPVHLIPVTFVAGSEAGKIAQTIRIETDLGIAGPELSAYAVVGH